MIYRQSLSYTIAGDRIEIVAKPHTDPLCDTRP